jgi:hypothetical protein
MDNVWRSHYDAAKAYLLKHQDKVKEYQDTMDDITKAEVNYSSIRAHVTESIDNGKHSKAALNAMVDGHKDVIDTKSELTRLKNKKDALKLIIDHLDKRHALEKKAIDAITNEMKYIGG